MEQERVLLSKILAIFTGIGFLWAASVSSAQTSSPSRGSTVYLMSGSAISKSASTLHDLSELKERSHVNYKATRKSIGSNLGDIGLDLKDSNFSKRNELESFHVQPWTPGRGGVGVKVEVTW